MIVVVVVAQVVVGVVVIVVVSGLQLRRRKGHLRAVRVARRLGNGQKDGRSVVWVVTVAGGVYIRQVVYHTVGYVWVVGVDGGDASQARQVYRTLLHA